MNIKEIIQRLKTAMDDARGQESHFESWLTQNEGICDAIDALKELDKTEQEPVAVKHMMEWVDYLKRKSDYGQHLQIPSGMSAGACWDLARELEQFITTPPQRTWERPWVSLTIEDIVALFPNEFLHSTYDTEKLISDVRIVEAKLKEKNNGSR